MGVVVVPRGRAIGIGGTGPRELPVLCQANDGRRGRGERERRSTRMEHLMQARPGFVTLLEGDVSLERVV